MKEFLHIVTLQEEGDHGFSPLYYAELFRLRFQSLIDWETPEIKALFGQLSGLNFLVCDEEPNADSFREISNLLTHKVNYEPVGPPVKILINGTQETLHRWGESLFGGEYWEGENPIERFQTTHGALQLGITKPFYNARIVLLSDACLGCLGDACTHLLGNIPSIYLAQGS